MLNRLNKYCVKNVYDLYITFIYDLLYNLIFYPLMRKTLEFIFTCWKNSKELTVNVVISIDLGKKLCGVPQGFVFGPLLSNIFLWYLFLIMDNIDIASYADDNAPYTTGNFFSGLMINKWEIILTSISFDISRTVRLTIENKKYWTVNARNCLALN